MATCTELYIDTLGGLDLDGSADKNLPYFVVENLATLDRPRPAPWMLLAGADDELFSKSVRLSNHTYCTHFAITTVIHGVTTLNTRPTVT